VRRSGGRVIWRSHVGVDVPNEHSDLAWRFLRPYVEDVDGYVVGMEAEVVDAQGRVQGRDKVMLHHIVFAKIGVPDYTCGGAAERFFAEGEERNGDEIAFRTERISRNVCHAVAEYSFRTAARSQHPDGDDR
jgi:hypothetical protein